MRKAILLTSLLVALLPAAAGAGGLDLPPKPAFGKALVPKLAPTATTFSTGSRAAKQPANVESKLRPITEALAESSPPTIDCRLAIDKIGAASFTDGVVCISKGVVTVRGKFQWENSAPYLTGYVVRLDAQGTADGDQRKMSGLVLFLGGAYLNELADACDGSTGGAGAATDDQVFRRQGSLSGQVTGIRDGRLYLLSKQQGSTVSVSLDSVTYLRSPHAFLFTICGRPSKDLARTQITSISFRPTVSQGHLNESVVAGKKPDPFDIDDMDDLSPAAVPALPLARQLLPGDPIVQPPPMMRNGRPFSNWP